MAALVASYLRSLPADEIAPVARYSIPPRRGRMVIGRVFPESEGRLLDLSGAAIARIANVGSTTDEQRQAIAAQAVDFGQSVHRYSIPP